MKTEYAVAWLLEVFWHDIGTHNLHPTTRMPDSFIAVTREEFQTGLHMGAMNTSRGSVRSVNNARLANAIINVLEDRRSGGIEGLIDRFVRKGLGDVINSWISPLENQPVSVAEIRRVLGRDLLGEISWQARIPQKEASSQMAFLLPRLVDRLTPTGKIPSGVKLEKRIRLVRRSLRS